MRALDEFQLAYNCRELRREFAERHADHLTVATLNVDDNPGTAGRYDVLSLPTLVLFKGGAPVERITGAAKPKRLEAAVGPHLTD